MSLAWNEAIFGKGLLSTSSQHHRKQRKGLNPAFSITHMREMVPTFYVTVWKLRQSISAQVSEGPKEIEMLLRMTRTALELIGQSGYGYSFDNLSVRPSRIWRPHNVSGEINFFDWLSFPSFINGGHPASGVHL